MRSAWVGFRGLALAARTVGGRTGWCSVLIVVVLCALGSQPTTFAAYILGCIYALFFLLNAMSVLGVNSLSPISVVKSLFRSPGWGQLLFATALMGCALLVFWLFLQFPEVARWIVSWTHGDFDLTTAFLIAGIATVGSSVIWGTMIWCLKALRKDPEEEFGEVGKGTVISNVNRSRAYWKKVSGALLLATVALVPAALLANWAWNVMASVLLPLFVLSTSRALDESKTSLNR